MSTIKKEKSGTEIQRLKKTVISTLIYTAILGVIIFIWGVSNASISIYPKVMVFMTGVLGFTLIIYILLKPVKEKQNINDCYHMSLKDKVFFVFAVGMFLFEAFFIFQLCLCTHEYDSFTDTLEYYEYCNFDDDCTAIACGSCVNSEGLYRYVDIDFLCIAFYSKCVVPDTCVCENNVCTARWDHDLH